MKERLPKPAAGNNNELQQLQLQSAGADADAGAAAGAPATTNTSAKSALLSPHSHTGGQKQQQQHSQRNGNETRNDRSRRQNCPPTYNSRAWQNGQRNSFYNNRNYRDSESRDRYREHHSSRQYRDRRNVCYNQDRHYSREDYRQWERPRSDWHRSEDRHRANTEHRTRSARKENEQTEKPKEPRAHCSNAKLEENIKPLKQVESTAEIEKTLFSKVDEKQVEATRENELQTQAANTEIDDKEEALKQVEATIEQLDESYSHICKTPEALEEKEVTKEEATAVKPAPKIQVRPLTELLRQEILAVTQGKLLDESDSETDKTPKKIIKPAIQLRRRTTSIAQLNYNGSREFNINASLATMDKESLKYIINNSDTIYNDHLKLRARRRLRVEIRRQLKELQSEQPKDKPATELIEDEIADAIKLPEILLQEIEKCFGIDISKEQNEASEESVKSLEEAAVHEECLETETMAGKRTNAHLNAAAAPKSPQSKCTKQKQQMKKVNTQQQLKVELEPTNAAAKSLKSAIKAELAVSDEVIVLSSSEDELEDEPQPAVCEDDVASNHSASSSSSNNSQQRRYQLKLQSDADNVVNSFETLILPHLKQSLVERYRSFHSINMQSRLHFISCVVTNSEYTTQTFSKIQVAKMQQNLKAADNRLGIEFLLREIVNVVNVQKQAAAARRKQELQQQQQQQAANELSLKSAELASEALQRSLSDEEAAAAHVAMPTPPHSDALISLRPMQVLPLSVPYLSLDTALTPGSSYSLDSCSNAMLLGDSVSVRLMEMDRRLLDNQNRRGFLEGMIMKYQKEKSDLEMQYLELQSHKFMLLNTLISRNQATTVTPPPTNTPTNSPPPPAAESVSSSPKPKPRRHRRTVLVKRLKVVAKRKLPVLKVQSPSVVPAMSTEASDDANIEMPLPLPAKVQIKLETVEQTTSTKRSRWSQEDTTAAEKVAPLLPPPPPPESIANMPYELPPYIKQLQPPPPPPTPQAVDTAKYDCIATGHLRGINSPITQIRVHQLLIIAASEGGDIYMFNMLSHKLQRQITKHSDAITQMFLCERESFLYTISLDGFLKKSSLENLERVAQTVYLKEPLQSIDVAWGTAYVGSRWGNIFTYDIAANKVGSVPLIFTAQSVIALKATEDSGHRIIVLGCKGNIVTLYDASDGMMLRRLSVPEGLNIYSLQIADGYIYCGSQKNEVLKFELARSTLATTMACGNGAVAMAIYEGRYLFVGCYDSFIYVLDMHSGQQVSRLNGPGRLVLALAIAGNKIIASSKDNSLAIMEIPTELLTASHST